MARFRERRRTGRVLTTISAAALILAHTPCLAARPISDAEASRRLDEARHDFEHRRFDRASATLSHLLKARPDDSEAAVLLCRVRAIDADGWEMKPVATRLIRQRFAHADDACHLATKVDAAPADHVWVAHAWARAADLLNRGKETVEAYRAWSAAAPDDPHAAGGLAAWLEREGKPAVADDVLARAARASAAVGQRARFDYACRLADPKRKALLEPVLAKLDDAEESPAGKEMIGALRTRVEEGANAFELDLLDLVSRGAITDTDARTIWSCAGGERMFFQAVWPHDADADVTVPKRKTFQKPVFPASMEREARTGVAILLIRVDVDGSVGPAWVALASAPPFGKAAVDCVRRWKFAPATRGGTPIPYPWVEFVMFDYPKSW